MGPKFSEGELLPLLDTKKNFMEQNRTGNAGFDTVDWRNQQYQLQLVLYPRYYKVSYIPGGCLGFLPSKVVLLPSKVVNV